MLLGFALGILTGMYLPQLLIWLLTRPERARRLSVDQIIIQALGHPPIPRPRGRHAERIDQSITN
jgi:hypothetical protein